jgi:hypothetical protein
MLIIVLVGSNASNSAGVMLTIVLARSNVINSAGEK